MFDVKLILPTALVAFAIGVGTATLVQDWRYGAIIADNAKEAKDAENKRLVDVNAQLVKMTKDRDDLARNIEKLDGTWQGKLKAAQDENTKLTDCLRTGKCGLRVNPGLCARPTAANVPAPTSPARVDDGADARLAESARQDYLNLRTALKAAQLKLEGLQEYIRTIQQKPEQ